MNTTATINVNDVAIISTQEYLELVDAKRKLIEMEVNVGSKWEMVLDPSRRDYKFLMPVVVQETPILLDDEMKRLCANGYVNTIHKNEQIMEEFYHWMVMRDHHYLDIRTGEVVGRYDAEKDPDKYYDLLQIEKYAQKYNYMKVMMEMEEAKKKAEEKQIRLKEDNDEKSDDKQEDKQEDKDSKILTKSTGAGKHKAKAKVNK